jgi:L-cysteine:1D-myo-inositol 2-amino-2-deoxy-alpha-D-glucopyranoside ligase
MQVHMTHSLHLYDTLTGSVRPFVPASDPIRLYVCGVTPYDTTHLGHAFTFVAFDVLIRYLHYLGHQVRYIQNVTDIDDPLFERARQTGVSYQDLATDQTERYLADMQGLNVIPADVYPRASGEIAEMIALIEQLIARGHAYAVDGHVYFSIATDPTYGELSKLGREGMIELARERGGNPDDPLRRDPLDFLLWRAGEDEEPVTPSPWGDGLPGWHLECSAMSLKYLGEPIDIHGGGVDLIFPHHESEIAQSEGATSVRPFVRHWMHTGMVYMGGEKMSKSLGNMVFVRDLLRSHGPNALRLYLAGHHYRTTLHWDEGRLNEATQLADRLELAASIPSGDGELAIAVDDYRQRFLARLNDDLDTPGAIELLDELGSAILTEGAQERNIHDAQRVLREHSGILGLRFASGSSRQ